MTTRDTSASDGVRCVLMRGGTSKGAYFLASDLPADPAQRDDLLLRIMGSPDPRQIDGIGGAHPLTSKVAVIAPSPDDAADVDYLFLQVSVDEPAVTDRQNCGNLLAGVGAFAVERGLVSATEDRTDVRIRMLNTSTLATARFATAQGQPIYTGDYAIAGVPGHAGAVRLEFQDTAGSTCGSLFPTGNTTDLIDGIEVTCIDNGMPVIVIRATDLGVTGYETCATLEANAALRDQIERIRLKAGPLMRLGDVKELSVPKLVLIAAPHDGGSLCTRSFIPHRCHDAIGVLGAVSVATAALTPGTPAAELAELDGSTRVVIEHPTGTFDADIVTRLEGGLPTVERSAIIRTARKLFDGLVFPREP